MLGAWVCLLDCCTTFQSISPVRIYNTAYNLDDDSQPRALRKGLRVGLENWTGLGWAGLGRTSEEWGTKRGLSYIPI